MHFQERVPINLSFCVVARQAVWENSGLLPNSERNIVMAYEALLEEQREETRQIIEELLEDGSDPDALYTIEHHLSCNNFDSLEKAAVDAFKLGYEVTEPEELELEDGTTVMCVDILSESALKAELIDVQVEQLVNLVGKYNVDYDGWGTYFEDPDAEEEDDDAIDDEDDDGVRH
jgi:regulator of ribonuclease activity B